ncbi:MAG TPA: hypothetical protein VIN06_06995 [Devosia sp.]
MFHEYRGYRIRLIEAERWNAEVVELASGALLPTKLIATPEETLREFSHRARKLVDIYVDTPSSFLRVLGPARPWQTILQ